MTHRSTSILILCLSTLLFSCRQSQLPELPDVRDISQYKETVMLPALESNIPDNKNVIYTPAFRYAWQEVTEALQADIRSKSYNCPMLSVLINTNDFNKALNEGEYESDVEVVGDAIRASAFFTKRLPFDTKLQPSVVPLDFGKTRVAAFGMYEYEDAIAKLTTILYYQDDDHFVLKLQPRDPQHEIILAKGIDTAGKLATAVQQIYDWIAAGQRQKKTLKWTPDDLFSIPVISFNIETHYKELEKLHFSTTDDRPHVIEEAYQRTAFAMDERGAIVESEAGLLLDSVAVEPQKIKPKRLVCDRSFYILLRKTGQRQPYFVMKVDNAELLKKED